MSCKKKDIKGTLDLYYRILYIPLYEKRNEIINKNSDFLIEHFKNNILSLKTGKEVFGIMNKKKLEKFYEQGRLTTLSKIKDIKKALREE